MADFITQFAADEGVSRQNFNNRITQANTALTTVQSAAATAQTSANTAVANAAAAKTAADNAASAAATAQTIANGKASASHTHTPESIGAVNRKELMLAQEINNPSITQPYITDVADAQATAVGLPVAWWHVIGLHHVNVNHGAQIAVPLNAGVGLYIRVANGGSWSAWQQFYDNSRILCGTGALVAGSTPLQAGAIYMQYE